jgi:uncharacterized protein YwqG
MTDDETSLDRRLRPLQRRAWLPEVVDEDGAPTTSKFSGTPVLRADEAWPSCPNCGKAMPLFVQLNSRDLPAEAAARLQGGLLQLFYCTSDDPHCESECEAFVPHARSTLLRILPIAEAVNSGDASIARTMFPPKRIVAWTPSTDLPNPEEIETLGTPLREEEAETLEERGLPHAGEKLRGWPMWVQGVEYPTCRQCGERMELLFQIDSEQSLPYMFGDVGVGHITQCPRHESELAFGWACG